MPRKKITETSSSTVGNVLVLVPVAIGDLVDKITIVEIKAERIAEPAKLRNIHRELAQLLAVRDRQDAPSPALDTPTRELKKTNEFLWAIEDDIRECEKRREFGARLIELARAVYRNNDRRANELSGSAIIEEKSYRSC